MHEQQRVLSLTSRRCSAGLTSVSAVPVPMETGALRQRRIFEVEQESLTNARRGLSIRSRRSYRRPNSPECSDHRCQGARVISETSPSKLLPCRRRAVPRSERRIPLCASSHPKRWNAAYADLCVTTGTGARSLRTREAPTARILKRTVVFCEGLRTPGGRTSMACSLVMPAQVPC